MTQSLQTEWDGLNEARQTELLVEYGHYLDNSPRTCSLEEKNVRFARWLAEKGIHYPIKRT
jgi:hypothetical protein